MSPGLPGPLPYLTMHALGALCLARMRERGNPARIVTRSATQAHDDAPLALHAECHWHTLRIVGCILHDRALHRRTSLLKLRGSESLPLRWALTLSNPSLSLTRREGLCARVTVTPTPRCCSASHCHPRTSCRPSSSS